MADRPFIQLQNISKNFPGVKALDDIHLDIEAGQVHALVGENGAGKSTLIKILAGNLTPDPGAIIRVGDQEKSHLTPTEALSMGIVVIYQDFSLFENLTVVENIAISNQMEKDGPLVDWKEMRKTARKALDEMGVEADLDAPLASLSTARQQLVAIARAIACDAKLIIMDEPTSALSNSEVENLFHIIEELKHRNIAVLFVSHKLEELFRVADIFTVLRDGTYIGTYPKEELDNDRLISLMVGRKVEFVRQRASHIGDPVLEVEHLSKKGCFRDISFTLRAGEILGITGLVGAGRTEVIQAICGVDPADSGEIRIQGEKASIKSVKDAIRYGIGYVPESRLTEGLILTKSTADNIVITVFQKLKSALGLLSGSKKEEMAETWIKKLNVKPGYPEMQTQKLSGGNQQRVVIAKWLATEPAILIVDEPTNGIDVGAKDEIHKLLRDLSDSGMGVIMVSSELPEVLAISDRILVMRRGVISEEFDGNLADQEQILNAGLVKKEEEGATA